jgi:hypothetical protein
MQPRTQRAHFADDGLRNVMPGFPETIFEAGFDFDFVKDNEHWGSFLHVRLF